MPSTLLTREVIGVSHEGRTIEAWSYRPEGTGHFRGPDGTLIIGGIHGDEAAGPAILWRFLKELDNPGSNLGPFCVVPELNPDGCTRNIRYNARGVDLNRNFPYRWDPSSSEPPGAFPLSEPEALALHDTLLERKPLRVICLHWALSEIDPDGEAGSDLADRLYSLLDLKERNFFSFVEPGLAKSLRAPLPGSFGRFCGQAVRYPDGSCPAMVTIELPYHNLPDSMLRPLPDDRLEIVSYLWQEKPDEYMQNVGVPVIRMLYEACRQV